MEMEAAAYSSKYPDIVHTDILFDARQSCYQARDAFYACLEKQSNNILRTEKGQVGLLYPVQCKKTREVYDKACRRTWVKHFDRQYLVKKKAQSFLDDNESRKGPISASTFKSEN